MDDMDPSEHERANGNEQQAPFMPSQALGKVSQALSLLETAMEDKGCHTNNVHAQPTPGNSCNDTGRSNRTRATANRWRKEHGRQC